MYIHTITKDQQNQTQGRFRLGLVSLNPRYVYKPSARVPLCHSLTPTPRPYYSHNNEVRCLRVKVTHGRLFETFYVESSRGSKGGWHLNSFNAVSKWRKMRSNQLQRRTPWCLTRVSTVSLEGISDLRSASLFTVLGLSLVRLVCTDDHWKTPLVPIPTYMSVVDDVFKIKYTSLVRLT